MKNILCKLGIHKPNQYRYVKETRFHRRGGKKYHRNYVVCERCGKKLRTFAWKKTGGQNNGI